MPCGIFLVTNEGKFITTDQGEVIVVEAVTTEEPNSMWTQQAAVNLNAWCDDE